MRPGTCRLFDPQPVTLTGKLVQLEPIGLEHAVDLYTAGAEESIWTYLPRGAFSSVADAERWIRDCVADLDTGNRIYFAVMHRETARAVGTTGYLYIERAHRTLEIGMTWYALEWQRTGVNTECKYLLLRHAFEAMGARRVSFKTDSRNERSRQAILRLGAVEEGVFRNHRIARDGMDRHSVFYSVIDSEWAGVRERLEGMMQQ